MFEKILVLVLISQYFLISYAKDFEPPFNGKFIPQSVRYTGTIENFKNLKAANISVSYRDSKNTLLFKEKFNSVDVTNGKFNIELGRGHSGHSFFQKYKSSSKVFSHDANLFLFFSINNKKYYPRVKFQPAGHKNGNTKEKPSNISLNNAYQAIILSADNKTKQPFDSFQKKTNPLLLNMNGPIVSSALRDLPTAVQKFKVEFVDNPPYHESAFDSNGIRYGTNSNKYYDKLADKSRTKGTVLPTPNTVTDFPGMSNLDFALPPDTEGAVGPFHYVQQINKSTSIYHKDGSIAVPAFNTNQLWTGFGGPCESDNSGDAITLYDEQADRWILSQFAIATGQSVCFAVSTTPDPTGSYFLYELATQRLPDYYKLGIWPAIDNNAIFMSTNSGAPGKYDVYALDRENMLAGVTPKPAQYFQDYYNLLMPADSDGTPPNDSTPGYFYTFRDGGESYFTNPTEVDSLDIFEFNVDWDNPSQSSFTRVQEITTDNGLAEFNWTVCGFFEDNCLPQPGGLKLNAHSWWPMQRFQFRQFGAKQVLVGSWVVNVEVSPTIRSAPRWFELNKSNGDWTLAQQGTFSPDSEHRFLPSIAMDASGGIGMVFSKVSENTFASMYYTAHGKSDLAGTMRPEKIVKQGNGVQTSPLRGWGDYASMDIDPIDQCTFWMTSEYVPITDDRPWETHIAAFRLPECVFMSVVDNHKDLCSMTSDSLSYDLNLSDGFINTTDLMVNNCPIGNNCSFSTNPVIKPQNNSTLNISGLLNDAATSHLISINANNSIDTSINNNIEVSLSIFDALAQKPQLLNPLPSALTFKKVDFNWTFPKQAQNYTIEIDDDPLFNSIDFNLNSNITKIQSPELNLGQCYYWRVTSNNVCGIGETSQRSEFYTHLKQSHPQINATDVPIVIAANAPNTATSIITVSGIGILADVDINNFTGAHTWLADLTMTLTSPSGTVATLMQNTCDDTDDWSINFDDDAPFGRWPCPATDAGTYQANDSLTVFEGENADGEWILNVIDEFSGDGGSFDSWGLTFESSIDPGIQVCNVFDNGFE